MAGSTLTRTGETPPSVRKGHGTAELGPTDSTDSGSDVRGGPGFRHSERFGLGDDSMDDDVGVVAGAGPDIGDRDLDSDSDRVGTGERAAAGRDSAGPADQTLYDDAGNPVDGEDIAEDGSPDAALDEPEDPGAPVDEDPGTGRTERERPSTGRESPAVERERPSPARGVGDVERDIPAADRSGRDPRV